MDIYGLISRCHEVLGFFSDLGNYIWDFLSSSFNIGNTSFSVLELLFGAGLIVYLTIKLALSLLQ